MPYSDLLKLLIEKIDGAVGVGFAAQDGEAVQFEGQLEDYPHRLHLAYQGILLQVLTEIHRNPKAIPRLVISIHQNYTVVVKPLRDGYFLVLTLKRQKSLHRALQCLEQVAEELNREL